MLNKVPENDNQMFHRANDPSVEIKHCELQGCDGQNILANMYSIKPTYALAGPLHAAFQCPEIQHYACSHEHAMLLAMHCLYEHVSFGPHAQFDQYKQRIAHGKLIRISEILDEPYGDDK